MGSFVLSGLTLKDEAVGRRHRESLVAFFLKSRQQEAWPEGKAPEVPRFVLAVPLLVLPGGELLCDHVVDQVARLLVISPIFQGYSENELRELIRECVRSEANASVEQVCTKVSGKLSLPLRETALSLAMQVVLSDGQYDEAEHDKLYEIAMALGIQSDRFLHMFEVLVILHRTLD